MVDLSLPLAQANIKGGIGVGRGGTNSNTQGVVLFLTWQTPLLGTTTSSRTIKVSNHAMGTATCHLTNALFDDKDGHGCN